MTSPQYPPPGNQNPDTSPPPPPPPPNANPWGQQQPPQAPTGYYSTQQGMQPQYNQWAFQPTPPRPRAKVGGTFVIAAAVVMIVGVFLPWVSAGSATANGMDNYWSFEFGTTDSPGIIALFGGVLLAGFGITLLAVGRVVAIGILTILASLGCAIMGLGLLAIVTEAARPGDIDLSIGVILQPIAPLLALVGGIVTLAKRR